MLGCWSNDRLPHFLARKRERQVRLDTTVGIAVRNGYEANNLSGMMLLMQDHPRDLPWDHEDSTCWDDRQGLRIRRY